MLMSPKQASKSYVTQTTSLYETAAELARRGFVVAVTSRNAPGIDLMATTPDMAHTYGIQVKGNHWEGTQSYWLTGERAKSDAAPGLFYVLVNLKEEGARLDFYVVPSEIVAKRLDIDERKTGSTWYSFSRDKEFLERWDLFA